MMGLQTQGLDFRSCESQVPVIPPCERQDFPGVCWLAKLAKTQGKLWVQLETPTLYIRDRASQSCWASTLKHTQEYIKMQQVSICRQWDMNNWPLEIQKLIYSSISLKWLVTTHLTYICFLCVGYTSKCLKYKVKGRIPNLVGLRARDRNTLKYSSFCLFQ